MADAEGGNAIIIKRVKKGGHAAAHGGAWKIAYADFVTAMMAFFLLLWLLNSVTEESLSGISNYFAPTTVSKSSSGAGGVLGGKVIGDGQSTSNTSSISAPDALPPPTIGSGGQDLTASPDPAESSGAPSQQDLQAAAEDRAFEQAKASLEQAIASMPEAKLLEKSLMVDNTLEGLRIQIVDQKGLTMFASGQSSMYSHTKKIIETVARIIEKMPQKIAVAGHTDATPFHDQSGYTNWELSADRALASRRVLIASGIPEERIDRVVGKAATEPLVAEDPTAPKNRRIAIVLLREFKVGSGVPAPENVKAFNLQ